MSGGVEDLVRRLDSSSDLLQLGQAAMARAAFHGAHTSVWAAVMAEPKVEPLVFLIRVSQFKFDTFIKQ